MKSYKEEMRRLDIEYKTKISLYILIFILSIASAVFPCCANYLRSETTVIKVEDKWIKSSGDSQKYLVSTDKGVFAITDLMFIGKFDSSDIYAKLKIGKRYNVNVSGMRLPFFSLYKQINKVNSETK